MKVKYIPQVSDEKTSYSFEGQRIIASHKRKRDEFDFTELPDGQLDAETIETHLDINPVISAEKKEGILWIELLRFIDEDESDKAVLFPDWEEVEN